ncbi:hypothetical protein DPMN_054900 [Dreissena polymorpha]|uniref:Uncharacterized protein n=1 Tax=Dreissena polymorpha TaxID=45954 RepID=A0A9D4HQ67_DREPO|nr:hypothetical protein DPMN_054900 [Dreissena polymorpha]
MHLDQFSQNKALIFLVLTGDEEEIDKQLGDLGDEDAEKLDEQMWGSDQEEEEEHSEVGRVV